MTEAEFYVELAKLPAQGWEADFLRPEQVRQGQVPFLKLVAPVSVWPIDEDCDFCPITAVCLSLHRRLPFPHDYKAAGELLGLDLLIVTRVMAAADGLPDYDTATRTALLRALHLVETPREVA